MRFVIPCFQLDTLDSGMVASPRAVPISCALFGMAGATSECVFRVSGIDCHKVKDPIHVCEEEFFAAVRTTCGTITEPL